MLSKSKAKTKANAEYRRRERKKLLDILGSICAKCGTSEKIQIHHVVPTLRGKSRGTSAKIRDWKMNLEKNKDNLKLLCSTCHHIEHDHSKCIHKELKEVKRYVCNDCGTMIRRDSPLVKMRISENANIQ